MAFSADELRVLRRALAEALRPTPASPSRHPGDIQEYLRLAEAVDEAAHEGGRLRMFQFAELARYREALPGASAGYQERLRYALAAGYVPAPDDLAALRLLRRGSHTGAEGLLRQCEYLAELDVRARLARRTPPAPRRPEPRLRLLALPGGRSAADDTDDAAKPAAKPDTRPARPARPARPGSQEGDEPSRKVPTPAEVWPRRRPGPERSPATEPSKKPDAPGEPESAPEERTGRAEARTEARTERRAERSA